MPSKNYANGIVLLMMRFGRLALNRIPANSRCYLSGMEAAHDNDKNDFQPFIAIILDESYNNKPHTWVLYMNCMAIIKRKSKRD